MNPQNTTLQLYHRQFKIPLDTYFEKVSDFLDPWNEPAYQHVVDQLLEENEDRGIVGMVRQEKDDNYIYLDATIRYAVNSQRLEQVIQD